MNRRSLIALGLATALARFFPIGREVDPKPNEWMDLMASRHARSVEALESLFDPIFRDSMCGYRGEATVCDKTVAAEAKP